MTRRHDTRLIRDDVGQTSEVTVGKPLPFFPFFRRFLFFLPSWPSAPAASSSASDPPLPVTSSKVAPESRDVESVGDRSRASGAEERGGPDESIRSDSLRLGRCVGDGGTANRGVTGCRTFKVRDRRHGAE